MDSSKQEGQDSSAQETANNSQSNQEAQQQQQEVKPQEPPVRVFNKTSVSLGRSHDDSQEETECSYCYGKRIVDNIETGEFDVEETGCKYQKLGFTTTKMRIDDFETCVNQGFTRCGCYVYLRTSHKSCCEIYQYRVNIDDFKISNSQKKTIRRFHNYLNYGNIHGPQDEMQEGIDQAVEANAGADLGLNNLDLMDKEDTKAQYLLMTKALIEKKLIEDGLYTMEGDLLQNHHVTFNTKMKCLQSNIFMIDKSRTLIQKFDQNEEIKKKYLKQLHEEVAIKDTEQLQTTNIEIKKGSSANLAFLNLFLNDSGQKLFEQTIPTSNKKKQKKQAKPKPKAAEQAGQQVDEKYTNFKNYLDEHIPYVPVANPKHVYTIEFRRTLYSEELLDVYLRYEKAVHKKDRTADELKRFVCASPLYDPNDPKEQYRIDRPSTLSHEGVNEGRTADELGPNPGYGTIHYQHRIDGKLVGLGVNDITKSVMNAQYFIYDPDYSFLCLGVLGALHEIEFMKMFKKNYNPQFLWYQLGEIVVDCPKVNYKLNYKPGTLIEPRTKKLVTWEEAAGRINHYKKMPLEFKKANLQCCELIDIPFNFMTEHEEIVQNLDITNQWGEWPFLYENTRFLQVQNLQQGGQDHCIPLIRQMVKEIGYATVAEFLFELKFEKKKESPKNEETASTDQKESAKDDKEMQNEQKKESNEDQQQQ